MRENELDKNKLEIWADYLLEHSLGGVGVEDRVMIKGEWVCWPLMEVLEQKVIEKGAIPDIYLIPPNNDRGRVWSTSMGLYGNETQWNSAPKWHEDRYQSMTKYIEVAGSEDPGLFTGLSAEQSAGIMKADTCFAEIRLSKPWVITMFPTPKMAEMEGLDIDTYSDFILGASTADPKLLRKAEEIIAPLIDEGKNIRISTFHPDENRELEVSMNIESSCSIMSYGLRNFPDGEIFTSPDARTVSGEIFIDLPVTKSGVDLQGIYLKFEGGVITNYSAKQGHEQLKAIIETDEGSKRLGEVAFGMNPGLDRVLKNPLFVEKVGGTLHIAIGASYDGCFKGLENLEPGESEAKLEALQKEGILNKSAQHVDIVADFREGGCGRRVWIDDRELVVRNRVWVPV